MSTLNRKFHEDLGITKKRLEETRTLVHKEIAGISCRYSAADKVCPTAVS